MSLPASHPAMRENRTLFPTTVVTVTADKPDRILVSGRNNRKIGATVEKGKFKGYGIYCLSLEERATCPVDGEARAYCYGNGMQMARRHKIGDGDVFFDRLGFEIAELLDEHPGLLIRLHVLGDFPSVEYVSFWKEVLDENPAVACFGYTHRSPTNWGGDEIGDAIQAVKDTHPDRFRIRWSTTVSRPDAAVVLDKIPRGKRGPNQELVCPAQTDATACCATCSLCWEAPAEVIGFIKHGRTSDEAQAETVRTALAAPAPVALVENLPDNRRRVQKISLPTVKPVTVPVADAPEVRHVKPTDLIIEATYQRDLSGKSISLIKKIVGGWDWAKFKPPVCAEGEDGLFVIDGQHTAIAAASHPHIVTIPVMVVKRQDIAARADAFVSQNTERVVMSPLQIFHVEVVAKKPAAFEMLKCAIRAGATIPRSPPKKGEEKPGEIVSIGALRRVWGGGKPAHFERVLRIAVLSGKTPVNSLLIRGIDLALKEGAVSGPEPTNILDDKEIAFAISKINIERDSADVAADAEVNLYRALASLIDHYVWEDADSYQKHCEEGGQFAPTALAS